MLVKVLDGSFTHLIIQGLLVEKKNIYFGQLINSQEHKTILNFIYVFFTFIK